MGNTFVASIFVLSGCVLAGAGCGLPPPPPMEPVPVPDPGQRGFTGDVCVAEQARDRPCHFVVNRAGPDHDYDLGVWLGGGRTREANIGHIVEWIAPPAFRFEEPNCPPQAPWVEAAPLHKDEWVIAPFRDAARESHALFSLDTKAETITVQSEERWNGTQFECQNLRPPATMVAVRVLQTEHGTPGPYLRAELDLIPRP